MFKNIDVLIRIDCLPEETPIRGNASAIDDETDRKNEELIVSQLKDGNPWAWCVVKVTGLWHGIEESEYLGCCSFNSEKDFVESGHYQDMKDACIDRIKERAVEIVNAIGVKP